MEKFTGIPVSFQLVWLLRILLSAFCGGLIGFERATQRKSAGLHTHVVVAIASTLFAIVSKYGFYDMLTFSNVSYDPSRIASLTVTGNMALRSPCAAQNIRRLRRGRPFPGTEEKFSEGVI